MLEKWKQRAIKMNFRKAVIAFAITAFALVLVSFAAVYGNFQSRIATWEQFAETDREYGEKERDLGEAYESDFPERGHDGEFRERKEQEWEEMQKGLHLSVGDIALIAGCAIIGIAVGVWYWLLVMLWTYRESYRMGADTTLWVLAALVFNLAAIAALYLYGMWKGTCTNCGRIRSGSGRFCDRCGSLLKRECPQCGQEMAASSVYCSNCGKKWNAAEA